MNSFAQQLDSDQVKSAYLYNFIKHVQWLNEDNKKHFVVAEKDDAPGVVALNILLIIGPFTVGVFSSILQKLLINAIDYKSETELTI